MTGNCAGAIIYVAPHAGAWIETSGTCSLRQATIVAPHAGAWIETAKAHFSIYCVIVAPQRSATHQPVLQGVSPESLSLINLMTLFMGSLGISHLF
ncbi:hypothetical protein G3N28_00535 [Desulfobacter hydrogenophilus]|nr:hypothetical protein [Desulfobacter hydrogenophilus]